MKIFIAGGTGFLGKEIIKKLLEAGHQITALTRNQRTTSLPEGVAVIAGSPLKEGAWQQEIPGHDVIINLTGHNIFCRWTKKNKNLILQSRIVATRNIVNAIEAENNGITLINGSASGYYGFCGDEDVFEQAPAGHDFLAKVCTAWEREAEQAKSKARVISIRSGIVLAANGGALARMLPGFRLGVAGRLGSGKQWFPWIHIDDFTAALLFLINNHEISGPVNICAPHPNRNIEFTKSLGKVLYRPTILPVPTPIVRLALGELGSVLLEGCRMRPGVLQKNFFKFTHPKLEEALLSLLT
ncbi:MAG: TIGR01777 family oxidoreductase [Desulfobulbaceae bacterium]|nr:TIGR01777 family oxidoreductase [Desulfobulbaceae bacterium]HIJ78011.1 TIGR01777 family protein [Deltaproteobacteria bacterium]